jgi:plasmid stabilization system protein ParE
MAFNVRFSVGARKDLRELHNYIAKNDSLENADYVAREIVRSALTLRDFPERGAHPPELLARGNRKCRQIRFKPYAFCTAFAPTPFLLLSLPTAVVIWPYCCRDAFLHPEPVEAISRCSILILNGRRLAPLRPLLP